MGYIGTVSKGVVLLPPEARLPEGTRVEVTPLPTASDALAPQDKGPTLAETLKEFIGMCEGLPEDLAENHDHYIHGTPKK
ncbi:MAG: hypothetical protein FJ279_25295 [Planctomycetes bacterium]|nr:hypothetical protein [Planctomycetota bacterium]MBM4078188.1 hypothetical protein [Planctomycetota bacterium]